MEIFFNELSILPKSETIVDAQKNVTTLLKTLKELRRYDYRVMRCPEQFYVEELCNGYTINDFLIDQSVGRDLKILLQSMAKSPYLKSDSKEEEDYITNTFESKNYLDVYVSTEGIASAYLNNESTISFQSCEFWKKSSLDLFIRPSGDDSYIVTVKNFWNVESVSNWASSLVESLPLNNVENIRKVFPEDKFRFDQQAIDELIAWYYDDVRYQNKIKELIFDIQLHPFIGGIGFTEVLKNENGKASKRIDKKDRIKYTYTNTLITIHQCKEHYTDK